MYNFVIFFYNILLFKIMTKCIFFYFISDARSCVTCDKVLAELEKIDDDTDTFGVDFVKINDKRLAKQYGIKNFPALTYFREKEPIIYEGKEDKVKLIGKIISMWGILSV